MRAAGQVPYSVGSCHGEWISDFIPEMMGEDISNQNLSVCQSLVLSQVNRQQEVGRTRKIIQLSG